MSLSIQKMVSDGTLSTIVLGVQYLQRNDIYLRIAGVDTPQSGAPSGYTWSFVDNSTLRILPVVPVGVEVTVYRRTDFDSMYNVYSQNAQFDESTIDENNQQLLYIAQEYFEQGIPGASIEALEYVRATDDGYYYRFKLTDGSYTPEFLVPISPSTKLANRAMWTRFAAESGYVLAAGDFETGGVLLNSTQVLLDESTQCIYSWSGAYPVGGYVVAPGTDPTSVSGYVPRMDALLRDELAGVGGSQLVFYKSPIANAIAQSLQSVIDLQPITPEMFGADGTVDGDTAAMVAAFAFAYLNPCKIELSRIYKLNQPVTCYYVQTHNKAIEIIPKHRDAGIEWHGPADSYVIDIHGKSASIGAIRLIESSGASNSNTGLRVCGYTPKVSGVRCTGSWKRGVLGVACLFGAEFNGVYCDLDQTNDVSAKTGVPLQLVACINASVNNGFATNSAYPFVFGLLLGENVELLKPPSLTETITWGNEGVTANQYKSTVTTNGPVMRGLEIESTQHVFDLIYNNFMSLDGLYFKICDGWFGAHPSTPALAAIFTTIGTGPAYVKLTGNTLSMGAATSAVTHTTIADVFDYPYSEFSQNTIEKWACTVSGKNRIRCVANEVIIGGTDVALVNSSANNLFIPNARKSILSEGLILGKDTPDGDGKLQVRANSGERLFNGATASGTILSTCPGGLGVNVVTPSSTAVLYVGSMTSSNRSINARGTVNASGSDYAEYIKKADGCGTIEKGQIVGINSSAQITDRFDDAVAFAIKSTDPSIVGGDTWGVDLIYPEAPTLDKPNGFIIPLRKYGQTDDEYEASVTQAESDHAEAINEFERAWSEYELAVDAHQVAYEAERMQYDRIAFSGQVPCNVLGSKPGDYVIPVRGEGGCVSYKLTASPTFDEYRMAVGQVWKILDDGRAWVSVKIA